MVLGFIGTVTLYSSFIGWSHPGTKEGHYAVEAAVMPTTTASARTMHRWASIGFAVMLPPAYTSRRRYSWH